jgi:hypothetical protein
LKQFVAPPSLCAAAAAARSNCAAPPASHPPPGAASPWSDGHTGNQTRNGHDTHTFVPPFSPPRALISFTPRSHRTRTRPGGGSWRRWTWTSGWTRAWALGSCTWAMRTWAGRRVGSEWGGGWGDDGLAPRAVRCQWRCAQRAAGRHTAVTVNSPPARTSSTSTAGSTCSSST